MMDDDDDLSTSAAEGKNKRRDTRNSGIGVHLDIGVTEHTGGRWLQKMVSSMGD